MEIEERLLEKKEVSVESEGIPSFMIEKENLIGEWKPPPEGGGIPVPEEEFIRNIRTNCKLDIPNLISEPEHDKIMVYVGGGTSAKLFLDEIREKSKDDRYRVFCSNNTHDWLVQNNIIPYVHFCIDPKKNKVNDVKEPRHDVIYMIGVQCNPKLFEKFEGYKVTRIMTYCGIGNGTKDYQIINALYSPDEFTPLDGGTMAGLRAMNLANILGYRCVEFYGFDSCFFEKDNKGEPIYYSFEKKRKENIMEAKTSDGRIFLTTPVFSSQARQFIKWKHKLPWIKFIIHGDSLTAHINKLDDEANKPKHNLLISDYMLQMNKELHKSQKEYGAVFGHEHAGPISVLAGQLIRKYGDITILDYGCGKGMLAKTLPPIKGLTVYEYDPCIEGKDTRPEPADIVVCTDVLEHIEPDCLNNVLDDLQRVTKKILYLQICTVKADKYFSDGTNTHLIQEDYEWWYPRLRKRFYINESKDIDRGGGKKHFVCILQAQTL